MVVSAGFKKTVIALSIGIGVFVLSAILIAGYRFYMELIQIQEIGQNFTTVFFKNTLTQFLVQVIGFAIVFFAIFFSLLRIRKTMLGVDESFHFLEPMFPIWILSFTLAIFAGNFIKEAVSSEFLFFANTSEWGILDPIFGQDVSYYVFIRPFLIAISDSLMGIAIFVAILVSVLYVFLYGCLGVEKLKDFIRNKKVVSHIIFHILMIVLIHLCTYKFKAEDILFSEFAGVWGAGFTDVYIWLKYYNLIPYISVLLIAVILVFLNKGNFKFSVYTALVLPVILIAFTVSALVTQYFHVKPAEGQVEAPYIKHHIDATRTAYGIQNIAEQEFLPQTDWTTEDAKNHRQTIESIALLDCDVAKTILTQLQSIRDYYEFIDVDTVCYKINGHKEAVMVSPRELKKLEESPTSQSYSNDKMRFTHGYGAVFLPANVVTEDGHPVLYVKDSPVVSTIQEVNITEPRIYYGEYDDDYSVVNTQVKEFDYLSKGQSVEHAYQGKSGISLTGINRLLFAIRYGDHQLLTSNFITSDSKILMNTNVLERVRTAAPFLMFDEDPYLLADSEGRFKWIVDAYTTTEYFPYAKPHEDGFNYIRNSAKAVVDAYDGTVEIYITDPSDKLIQVYRSIYPEVFTAREFPSDLKYSLRYPETYFNIQADILKQYHITDAVTFYNRSDEWEVANEISAETSTWKESISEDQTKSKMKPSYQMLTVNGKQELTLMIPFSDKEKDNMAAWFTAGSDGDCYGNLTLVQFPQGETVYGPLQIEKRVNSNPEIDSVMSALGTGESTIIRGNLVVVPVSDSVLYAEPIYVTSGKNTLPELKMVVAAYDNKIAVKPTLQQAVEALFVATGAEQITDTQPVSVVLPPEVADKNDIEKITEAFNRVQQATKNNDWEAFGTAMKDLEALINDLNASSEATE